MSEFVRVRWSGSNSFIARDSAANKLANKIMDVYKARPSADIVLIGHSHGGNVVMKVLSILKDLGGVAKRPFVVTIATPFVQLQKPFHRKSYVRVRTFAALALGSLGIALAAAFLIPSDKLMALIPLAVLSLAAAFLSVPWVTGIPYRASSVISRRITQRMGRLITASNYGNQDDAAKILVVRGVEDEATLVLALGSVGLRLIDLAAILIYLLAALLVGWAFLASLGESIIGAGVANWIETTTSIALVIWSSMLIASVVLIFFAGIFKSVFGRELIFGAMPVGVAAASAPDVTSAASIVTLSRRGLGDALLLHSLYNHPLCAITIVKWLAHERDGTLDSRK